MRCKAKISKLLAIIIGVTGAFSFNPVNVVNAQGNEVYIEDIGTVETVDSDTYEGDSAGYTEEQNLVGAQQSGYIDEYIWEVLTLVNNERSAAGLDPLVMDVNLVNTANVRAKEIVSKFDHERPDGTKCWTAYSSNVTYWAKGENIAAGQRTPKDVMKAWMNSTDHKKNILSGSFNCIGISCYYDPNSDYGFYWVQNFGYTDYPKVMTSNTKFEAIGIKTITASRYGFLGYAEINNPTGETLEYSWYISTDNGSSWRCIVDWTTDDGLSFRPAKFGEYSIVVKARKAASPNEEVSAGTEFSYHPVISGKCQMPYTGQGGGWLIGVESYENPDQSYQYEMLILDCNLYVQGKDAWIYTTGRCGVADGKALWVVWQPVYGYYWTLFRVYDKDGNLLDEVCYGFENVF